jgi:hypothetical protein
MRCRVKNGNVFKMKVEWRDCEALDSDTELTKGSKYP